MESSLLVLQCLRNWKMLAKSYYVFGLFLHPSVHSSGQILLPRYSVKGLSNLDETYRVYSVAPTDDLIRFRRSKVKVAAGGRGGRCIHIDAGVLEVPSSGCRYTAKSRGTFDLVYLALFCTWCVVLCSSDNKRRWQRRQPWRQCQLWSGWEHTGADTRQRGVSQETGPVRRGRTADTIPGVARRKCGTSRSDGIRRNHCTVQLSAVCTAQRFVHQHSRQHCGERRVPRHLLHACLLQRCSYSEVFCCLACGRTRKLQKHKTKVSVMVSEGIVLSGYPIHSPVYLLYTFVHLSMCPLHADRCYHDISRTPRTILIKLTGNIH